MTEGDDLTFNVVFNVLEEIAAPNKDLESVVSLNTVAGTADVNDDYENLRHSRTRFR